MSEQRPLLNSTRRLKTAKVEKM